MNEVERATLDLCRQLWSTVTDAAPLLDRNGVSAARLLTITVGPIQLNLGQGVRSAAWFARPLGTSLAGLVERMEHAAGHSGLLADTRTWGTTNLLCSVAALHSDIPAVIEVEDAVWKVLLPHLSPGLHSSRGEEVEMATKTVQGSSSGPEKDARADEAERAAANQAQGKRK